MSKFFFDITRENANIKNGNIQETIYDTKIITTFVENPIDTWIKKRRLTQAFPIKILGNTLTVERKMMEAGLFYSIKTNDEELLIRKTVDGKIQIYEVIE